MSPSLPPPAPWLPLALLCGFGCLTGVILPLAKLAEGSGLAAPAFALWQALGASLLIFTLATFRRQRPRFDRRHLRYYLLGGLVGFTLPNIMLYLAVPRLGAGLAALSYAFSPLFTLVLSAATGTESLQARRIAGILLGFAGTLMLALPRGQLPAQATTPWLLLGIAAPFSLAVGNVYRTRDWPPGAAPLPLAGGVLLGAAASLVPALLLLPGNPFPDDGRAALPVLGAAVATGLAYMMFLELQQVAGPVYLSQVSFVITATGMAVGVIFLGERYGAWVWAAMATIFLGVALTASKPPRL